MDLRRRRVDGPSYQQGVDELEVYASLLWELYGVRVWNDDDLSRIDADLLDSYLRVAKHVLEQRTKGG
ncbi:MAG: hypothetical protein ACXV5Q_01385 [Frankiaceae bacterium]